MTTSTKVKREKNTVENIKVNVSSVVFVPFRDAFMANFHSISHFCNTKMSTVVRVW